MTTTLAISNQDFKNLDGIEIKMTLADEHRSLIRSLLPSDLIPQKLTVYFFDTPDLSLFNTHQVILRARSKVDKKDDSTVKLRRVDPDWTFTEWRNTKGEFKVEGDWVSDKLIRSASFTMPQAEEKIEQVAGKKVDIEKLFSKEQENFLAAATNTIIDFSKLKILGPIDVTKWKPYISSLETELCLEYWQLSNPQDILQEKKEILELSVKVECDGAQKMWDNFNQFLEKHGIDPMGEQAPKTRTALDYFAGSVQASPFQ